MLGNFNGWSAFRLFHSAFVWCRMLPDASAACFHRPSPPELHELHNQPPAAKPIAESLSGLIERVTFWNEENGFAVLKVKAKGHRDQVTVVGSLPSVSAGEWVTAEGKWVQDREF